MKMKNLKKLIATLTLTGIIILTTTNVQAGMLMSDLAGRDNRTQPCSEKTEKTDTKVNHGIIVSFTGIIVSLTGIIVSFTKDDAPTNCGIMMSD
jgi:hypothetical protein